MRCLCPSSWWGMNLDRNTSTHLPSQPQPFRMRRAQHSLSSQALHFSGKGPGLSLFPIGLCTPLPSMGAHSSQLSCRSRRDQAEFLGLLWPRRRVVATVSDLEAVRDVPLLLWGVSPPNSRGTRRRGLREIRPPGKGHQGARSKEVKFPVLFFSFLYLRRHLPSLPDS